MKEFDFKKRKTKKKDFSRIYYQKAYVYHKLKHDKKKSRFFQVHEPPTRGPNFYILHVKSVADDFSLFSKFLSINNSRDELNSDIQEIS